MSKCNLTRTIAETECIGDSLVKINTNFAVLDRKVCDVPVLVPGNGTDVSQLGPFVSVGVQNSFVYKNVFDTVANGVTYSPVLLSDDSPIPVNRFPITSGTLHPFGTFIVAAPNNNPPKVALYWTQDTVEVEATNRLTVYATNSSASYSNKGNTYFNDSVNCIHRINNTIYVGGKFTSVGERTQNKFVVLSAGTFTHRDYVGSVGTVLTNPLSSLQNGDLGQFGEVKAITSTIFSRDGNTENAGLIVAGSFGDFGPVNRSLQGRGLIIVNLDESDFTKNTEKFYVNGTVNCVSVVQPVPDSSAGSYLLIGGDFDYISSNETDAALGERVYTNGLAKIDLGYLSGAYAIDRSFAAAILSLFDGKAIVNAICSPLFGSSEKYAQIHIGGSFRVVETDEVVAQNLVAIDEFGGRKPDWSPIVDGPVHALVAVKPANLGYTIYVGGKFKNIRYGTNIFERSNAAVIIAESTGTTVSKFWTPSFNGPVTSFAFNDPTNENSGTSYVYCYGLFDRVNDLDAPYLAALTVNNGEGAPGGGVLQQTWRPKLQRGPEPINNAITIWPDESDDGHSLFVGGNFDTINSKIRYKLARIEGVDSTIPGKSVYWKIDSQIISNGDILTFDESRTSTVTVSSFAEPKGKIAVTSFPPLTAHSKGTKPGQLYRFRIERPGISDTLNVPVNLIGWTLDFN